MNFNISVCLRTSFLTRMGSVMINPRCNIRGRSSTDPTDLTHIYKSMSETEPEMDDHEVYVSRLNRPDEKKSKQYRDIYDKARSDFDNYTDEKFDRSTDDFHQRKNFNNGRRQSNRFDGQTYGKKQFFDRNDRFDEFDDQRQRKKQFFNRNDRFDEFNDQRQRKKQFFDRNDRFDQFNDQRQRKKQSFDQRDQYIDKKSARDYKNFNYKNKMINDFSDEDNALYRDDRTNLYDHEPRFSRQSEQQFSQFKKAKRIKNYDEEESFDNYDNDETPEEHENQSRQTRPKIPLPYNVTKENRFEVLNQIVTPLHLKPYNIQLKIKFHKHYELLRKFGAKLKQVNSTLIRDNKGLPCPLEQVKPSPLTERYRNKDEFSIWPGVDGYSKTLGFFIGQPSIHENVVCVEPDQIIVSRESHLSIAKKFQNYLKEVTQYDSCQNYGEGGNWRRFHIRSNSEGHHMITAIMHPQELTQQELDDEMKRYRDYFDGDPRISSVYFQASQHTRMSNEKAPFNHLSGDKTIMETLFDKKFEISVDSFFQINPKAAEVLNRTIVSELSATRNTTVLDICCGTGTLATIIAPDVCRVIGIDSSQSAISDANNNARLNGVKNTTFMTGSVENLLPQLMDDLYSQDIVVVANPSRAGLKASVINAIREMPSIRKVVYVSCKPEGYALKNFVHLCMPANRENRQLGPAFLPINAVPVDMFPHTTHCELVITFERF